MARASCLLAALALAGGCGSDEGPQGPADAGPDAGGDALLDTAQDASADLDAAAPLPDADAVGPPDADTSDAEADAAADGAADVPSDLPHGPDAPCTPAERLAACDSPLLLAAPMPEDPDDPLYYVNRVYPIPASYPISDTSTWTPCGRGGRNRPRKGNDLICVPSYYSSKQVALREAAWDAPAPLGPVETWDGKPAGFNGRIGFKALFDAAYAEVGAELFVASGYRSYATQDSLFASYVASEKSSGLSEDEAILAASTFSAMPGHSEHQLGTTVDMVYRKDDGEISGFGRATAIEMASSWQMKWVMANAHRFGIALTYGRDKVATTQYVWEPWHWRFVGFEAANAMSLCDLNTEELLSARYGVGPLPSYAGETLILWDEATLVASTAPGTLAADPGEKLSVAWTFRDTGTTNWIGYLLGHTAGESFGFSDLDIPCTVVDELVELGVELEAPLAPGLHVGRFEVLTPQGEAVPGGVVEARVWVGEASGGAPYRYVRIDDLSGVEGGADPGADIDAVVITRQGSGEHIYATAVTFYYATPSPVSAGDPAEALGPPDAFYAWPDDLSVCIVDGGFVSLGGAGSLIVEMPEPIVQGDILTVLEVGACTWKPGSQAFADPIAVKVSVGDADTDVWEPVGQGPGGVVELPVEFLPPAP
ncbi:MAG: D-alanyl-D-alanine carboxypeptidase family protein [Deltaproteobacteria bacterium]|nr:D-alanyl-D-alanine carboxypeptidase family protein [Deltaproteobacteria bacterium]MCB9787526.1 D-alanyl-D-alanine carboxypeptidase family protein [Deltaproteobacteria bacterium]